MRKIITKQINRMFFGDPKYLLMVENAGSFSRGLGNFLETFSDSLRIGLLIGLNSAENRCDANVATTIATITGRRKTAIITEHSNISKILGIFVSPISLYFQILPL